MDQEKSFEALPQDMQVRIVRKLIEEYEFSYGVAAHVLVKDSHRRGVVAGICRKHDIKVSIHRPGFKHLKKGPGGVVLRLDEQEFPSLEELLSEVAKDIAAEETKKAAAPEVEPPAAARVSPPAEESKKYKEPPPGVIRKLTTNDAHQCAEMLTVKLRCGVEKAPGSRFCYWHQPLAS